ncbi:MAG: hypothetical protein ACFN1B_07075, partial [Prevotella denticola]
HQCNRPQHDNRRSSREGQDGFRPQNDRRRSQSDSRRTQNGNRRPYNGAHPTQQRSAAAMPETDRRIEQRQPQQTERTQE